MTRILPDPSEFFSFQTQPTPVNRRAWIWQSRLRTPGAPYTLNQPVQMELNPSQVDIQQTKRIARADVRGGSVFFHGVNTRGEDNDIMILGLRGSTGDMRIPAQGVDVGSDRARSADWRQQALSRRRAFWAFANLSREAILLRDGSFNEITVTVVTPVLRAVGSGPDTDMVFTGFFSQPVTWSESAMDKGTVDWTCEFTVRTMFPDFYEVVEILAGEEPAVILPGSTGAEIV